VGDNAILGGLQDALQGRAGAQLVFTARADVVRAQHGLESLAPRRAPFHLLGALAAARALWFTGGTPFFDDAKHMLYFACLALVARACGVRIGVIGIGVRCMRRPVPRRLAALICRLAAYVSGRDEDSVTALRALCPAADVRLLPDPGLRLDAIGADEAEALLAPRMPTEGGPRVAIAMRDFSSPAQFRRAHYNAAFPAETVTDYIDKVAEVVTLLVRRRAARVMFLPMNTVAPDDDRAPAHAVMARLPGDVHARVQIWDTQPSARVAKGLLGRMDLVISTRFHALVLATGMCVPTISIGYAPKNAAIMAQFGRAQYAHQIGALDPELIARQAGAVLDDAPRQRASLRTCTARLDAHFAAEFAELLRATGLAGPARPV
jgi:polysaccharide pyruvyl transferase WcaK-like protein